MPTHHMAELVRQQCPDFILVEDLERRSMKDDEWIVHTVCAGVEEWRLGDVQLGNLGPVEGGTHLDVPHPELGKLVGAHPDGVALKQEPNAAFATEDRQHLADHFVDARHGPQCLQGGSIGGVLPADGGNFGKGTPGTGGGDGGHGGSFGGSSVVGHQSSGAPVTTDD